MNYIGALDGFRAIAVSLVLLTHLWQYPRGYEFFNRFAQLGWAGVDLFFVLSGFLITRILLESKNRPFYFRNFYARRSLRIFPAYYVLLALVLLAVPSISHSPGLESVRLDGWMYVLYLSNFAIAAGGFQLFLLDITWSLAVEEQFYLLWPAIVKFSHHLGPVCRWLVIGLPVVRSILWMYGVDWIWIHMMMPLRADSFAVGALVAMGLRIPFLTLALIPVILTLAWGGNYDRSSMLVGTIGYSLNAFAGAAILSLALSEGRFARLLSTKPFRHVGKVSYGIYLFHPICLAATVSFPVKRTV